MRLPLAVAAAALGSVATASSQSADAYLFRQAKGNDGPASIPRQAARLLVQQRLGADGVSSLQELMGLLDEEAALDFLNRFGQQSTFLQGSSAQPSQLVILVEGLDSKQMTSALPGLKSSFEVAEPPCSSAHGSLLEELSQAGVRQNACDLGRAIDAQDAGCWGGAQASIARFDAQLDSQLLSSLDDAAPELARLAETGELETLLLLMPESSRDAEIKSWSTAQKLHRRQAEAVIVSTDETEAAPQPTSTASRPAFPSVAPKGKIQSCFASFNSCMQATGNCSGHGECRDRWNTDDESKKRDGEDAPKQCFSCSCLKTVSKNNSTTHWAGKTCEKIDVSSPFILIFSFTIFIVAVMAGAIKMLSDVGDAPLPSVLMSGVAKK